MKLSNLILTLFRCLVNKLANREFVFIGFFCFFDHGNLLYLSNGESAIILFRGSSVFSVGDEMM